MVTRTKQLPNDPAEQPAGESRSSIIDEILTETLAEPRQPPPAGGGLIGRVVQPVDDAHPTSPLVLYELNGEPRTARLRQLRGVRCRAGDAVLLQPVGAGLDPVIAGALDSLEAAAVRRSEDAAVHVLAKGAAITVAAEDGTPLVAIANTGKGPTVTLLTKETRIDLPGTLAISADAIRLEAKKGDAELLAPEDIIISGRKIFLN